MRAARTEFDSSDDYRSSRRSAPVRAGLVGVLLALLATGLPAQEEWRFSGVPRVVAVADVHGAHDALVQVLQAAELLGPSLEWTGGNAHLVSLGDLLDRGPDSRAVMDLLMRLQDEAAAAGGAVHVVLGNHEIMNLVGDLRYVSAQEYAAFADDEPADVRAMAYRRFVAAQPQGTSEGELRAAFEERYPSGYFGHRAAFQADGRYGEWLVSLPALIVVNDTAFVHGGLPEMVTRAGAEELNRRIRDTLRRHLAVRAELAAAGVLPPYDMEHDVELARAASSGAAGDTAALLEELLRLSDAPELGLDGPIWYRGAAYCNPLIETPILEQALERLGAARVVVGHTVTDDRRVRSLYDDRMIMLDTGMLTQYYSGRPAALEVSAGRVFYLAPPQTSPPERARVEAHGLTEAQLLEALAAGTLERADEGAVVVRHDGRELRATFHPDGRGGSGDQELAAHALDRLLGLAMVPPTVAREIDGDTGALQLTYPDAISESRRVERRLPPGTWCPIEPQIQLMYAFDVLTFNVGRTPDTMLYRRDLSAVKLIGHGRAFGTERRIALQQDVLSLPAPLVEALSELDEAGLEQALGGRLDRRQVRALLARRDALLERTEPL